MRGQPARWGGGSCCSRCSSLSGSAAWGDLHCSKEKVLKRICCIKSALRSREGFRVMLFVTFVWLPLLIARGFFSFLGFFLSEEG